MGRSKNSSVMVAIVSNSGDHDKISLCRQKLAVGQNTGAKMRLALSLLYMSNADGAPRVSAFSDRLAALPVPVPYPSLTPAAPRAGTFSRVRELGSFFGSVSVCYTNRVATAIAVA